MSESQTPQGPSKKDAPSDAHGEHDAVVQQNTTVPEEESNTPPSADDPAQENAPEDRAKPVDSASASEASAASLGSGPEQAPPADEPIKDGGDRHVPPPVPPAGPPPTSTLGAGKATVIAVLVALVVSAGMVGAAGMYGRQQQQQLEADLATLQEGNQQQRQAVADLGRALQQQRTEVQNAVDQQLAEVRQQLEQQAQRQIQQQESQITRLKERIDGHQQRLASLSTTSREDWLLAEAEYLLKLANQRVLLERLPDNAIALLQAADGIIRQVAGGMGDAELFAIREALANELAALKLVESIDRDGVYLQLNALARRIDDLPRVPSHNFSRQQGSEKPEGGVEDSSGENETAAAPTEAWWQSLWIEVRDMAGLLDDYIRIESADTPVKPLVDQYTSQAAVLNIRLLLEQAQVALLKEQPVAYRQSLQQAQTMIKEYFIASAPAREVSQSLQQLEQLEISPQLPDVSRSLKMLNDYVQQLHRLQPAAEGQL